MKKVTKWARRLLTDTLPDVCYCAGCGCIVYGASLVCAALGFAALGAALIVTGLLLTMGGDDDAA